MCNVIPSCKCSHLAQTDMVSVSEPALSTVSSHSPVWMQEKEECTFACMCVYTCVYSTYVHTHIHTYIRTYLEKGDFPEGV